MVIMSRTPLRLCVILLALLALAGTAHAEPVLDPEEDNLWTLLNDHRQAHGVQPVGLNDQLMAAAGWMSGDMAANDYCSHTDSLGRSPKQRMADFGYFVRLTTTGENLACGVATAQEAFDLMKGSPDHDANILSPYAAIGIARAYNEASAHGWYWTVDLGGRGPAWFPPESTATPTPSPVPTPTPTPTPVPIATPVPSPTPAPTATPTPAELPVTGTRPTK